MILRFNDGSFMAIEKENEDSYMVVVCAQKPNGTTMSYVYLDKEKLNMLKDQIEEWTEK